MLTSVFRKIRKPVGLRAEFANAIRTWKGSGMQQDATRSLRKLMPFDLELNGKAQPLLPRALHWFSARSRRIAGQRYRFLNDLRAGIHDSLHQQGSQCHEDASSDHRR